MSTSSFFGILLQSGSSLDIGSWLGKALNLESHEDSTVEIQNLATRSQRQPSVGLGPVCSTQPTLRTVTLTTQDQGEDGGKPGAQSKDLPFKEHCSQTVFYSIHLLQLSWMSQGKGRGRKEDMLTTAETQPSACWVGIVP